jgi:hypothetical protein
MKWEGHVAHIAGMGIAYKILVWNPEEKGLLERSRWRWDDNIKIRICINSFHESCGIY